MGIPAGLASSKGTSFYSGDPGDLNEHEEEQKERKKQMHDVKTLRTYCHGSTQSWT
jgi:hypothetical protein